MWTVSRVEADKRGNKLSDEGYGVCGQGLSVPVIFEDGSMNAQQYINEVLPIALKSGNRMLGNDWTYQQDDARSHIHHLSQKNGVLIIFLHMFLKIGGLLNHLIYVHWIIVFME